MRTTLTLDDDLVAKLREEALHSGRSFKEMVNTCLRLGLKASKRTGATNTLQIRARDLNARPGIDLDNIAELLEQIEGPDQR